MTMQRLCKPSIKDALRFEPAAEDRSAAQFALRFHHAAVGFDDVFDDRKPQARTAFRFRARPIDDVEALEDVRKRVRGYAGPRVGYFDGGARSGAEHRCRD